MFSDPATMVLAWNARSYMAVMPREAGAGVDERRDVDGETVVCRWRL